MPKLKSLFIVKGDTSEKPLDKKKLADWNENFRNLVDYKKQFGNCDVPFLWDQNKKLANWVRVQRNIKNRLSPTLKKRLIDLGFDFTNTPKTWDENFELLKQFAEEKGHIYLPIDDPSYVDLREWLLKQIRDKDYLIKEHYDKLEALDVDWKDKTIRSGRWLEMYGKLQEFKQLYGHCRVPQGWDKDLKLSNWIGVQRRMKKRGKLSADRKMKLNKLGFVWDFQEIYEDQWEHYYKLLLQFKKTHGHCIVPGKYRKLAGWVDRQRTYRHNGKLTAAREKRLTDIGFIWNFNKIKEEVWQEKYVQLCEFKDTYGHCFVPVNWKENKSLGCWVATQRNLEIKGKLGSVKKKKLDRLGFVWKKDIKRVLDASYESKWTANYKKLEAYNKKWGTCQVSVKLDPGLQRWTSLQRRLYNLDKLSPQRIFKLTKLGFPWAIDKAYWRKMYKALLDFHQNFGHTRVPWGWPQNPHLARWVHSMKLKRKELDKQEVSLLDAINFDWKLKRRVVVPWEEMYRRLEKFKLENGHTRVPVQWKEDTKLGKWASRMRYDKMNLDRKRIDLLNKLGFDWGNQELAA